MSKERSPLLDTRHSQLKVNLTAYLVGIQGPRERPEEAAEHLGELRQLVETMGVPIAGEEMVVLREWHPKYLIGSGKAEAIKAVAEGAGAKLIVVDSDLSPVQQRAWEQLTGEAVIDRQEVILDIFAGRARTKEAQLQIELARLEYSLPRLTRAWTHLERQRGGGGSVGGAGEGQLELDRRMVRDDIFKLKRDLKLVRQQRETQRKSRREKPIPTVALVGYTNSGKSSLLNALTGAGVLSEDKLFATLDPTTRRVRLANNQELLLTDTVGFIRKLPHNLVEAFKATLEEALMADMLLHVIDSSHPSAIDQLLTTEEVLKELGADGKETVFVLNKVDLPVDEVDAAALRSRATPNIRTSTVTGEGLEELRTFLASFAGEGLVTVKVVLPPDRYAMLGFLHAEGNVMGEKFEEDGAHLEVQLPPKFLPRIAEFIVSEGKAP